MIEKVKNGEIVLSRPARASGTDLTLTVTAGPGNVPANEVQKLTVGATTGTYALEFQSPRPDSSKHTTGPISAAASHEEVQAALEGLSNIGAHNVSVSGGPGDASGSTPYRIEFLGRYSDSDLSPLRITSASLSGGAAEANVTTLAEGGGALETCTSVCAGENKEQDAFENGAGYDEGENPGQLRASDEIAVDNDPGTLAEPNPSYGDVYVVDQRNFRVEKYSPTGEFLLMFGGEVDKTKTANSTTGTGIADEILHCRRPQRRRHLRRRRPRHRALPLLRRKPPHRRRRVFCGQVLG